MIKIEKISVYNFENSIRGMRNALKSWDRSDSYNYYDPDLHFNTYIIGENDMKLALKLIKAGSEHSKFCRQIFISMDITAPDYWWKEMDTYKINTTANSTSTMHKITSRLLDMNDFSIDEWDDNDFMVLNNLNQLIEEYQNTKDKNVWRRIIQKLPMSYNYLRTWTANYQNLRNMYFQRRNHKLDCWQDFCKVIEGLPYSQLITIS
jgi:hypothetical protein